MPYKITVDTERRMAIVVGSAPNDLASSLAAMEELASRPDYGAGFGMLCDFRENDYTPGLADSRELAEAHVARFSGHPMAVVVKGLLHYGVANMITTLINLRGIQVAVFRELAEAETWLESHLRET